MPPAAAPQPVLRRDLDMVDAGYDITGERGLVLHDQARHRFFRLPFKFMEMLEELRHSRVIDPESDDTKSILGFLEQNRLLDARKGIAESLLTEHLRGRHSAAMSLLHNYISFRIPLLSPEPFLDRTLAWVTPLASRSFALFLLALTVIGSYFVVRQWDVFSNMLWSSFSVAGALSYALTLFVLKTFHEFGHAYTARHFGCRVPSIGIAFMVMTPMLYTDASDAWRLSSRKQRFLIGAAGAMVEIAIAAVALFLWAFLPDGAVRSMCFFLAVTAWMTSLLVNLSPFMRFDGYHMLVDALGMHSAGPRSFAIATWRLREMLFKPDDPPPEMLPRNLQRWLIAFAAGTCVYRLTLFLGIAWFLYVSLPKAAGLPLAAVEIYFFILLPIIRELKVWKSMGLKYLFSTARAKISLAIGFVLLVLSALPLDRHIHVPAVLLAQTEARLFPSEPARVVQVFAKPGDQVDAGQVLIRLYVPDIEILQRQAQLRHDIADAKLRRIAADATDRANLVVTEREVQMAVAELDGLKSRAQLLEIRAPVSGLITGDAKSLRIGQWVGRENLLVQIVNAEQGRMVGLLLERESARVTTGAEVVFVPEDGLGPAVEGVVSNIGLPGGEGRSLSYLTSQFGGAIPVEPGQAGKPVPGYLPLFINTASTAGKRALPGTAVVDAEPQSLLGFLAGRVATVMLRESGF